MEERNGTYEYTVEKLSKFLARKVSLRKNAQVIEPWLKRRKNLPTRKRQRSTVDLLFLLFSFYEKERQIHSYLASDI